MPTNTFFRLPEEKRTRFMDAAWQEFTRVPFSEVSINKIIQNAHIPRGSFYQYFVDKEDLFHYLFSDLGDYFSGELRRILNETQGDLFAVPLHSMSHFFQHRGAADPILLRCLQVLRINQGMDLQQLLSTKPQPLLPPSVREQIDLSRFRRTDDVFVEQVFILVVMTACSTIMETLCHPERQSKESSLLQERVDIIRHGALRPEAIQTL